MNRTFEIGSWWLVVASVFAGGCGAEQPDAVGSGSASATNGILSLVNPLIPSVDVGLGGHVVGVTSEIPLTLTNVHSKAVTLGRIAFDRPDLAVNGGTCRNKLKLAPGASCTINVLFTPMALVEYAAYLVIFYRSGSSGQRADNFWVTGTGEPAVVLSDPQAVDLGRPLVGTSETKTVTVTNLGTSATLGTITDAALGVNPPYALSGGSCVTGAQLEQSRSCTLDFTFSPTIAGAAPQPISVFYTLDGLGTFTLESTLYGTAITDPSNCFQASCPAQHVCQQTSASPLTGTCLYVPPPPAGCMAPCEWEARKNCLPALGDCTEHRYSDEHTQQHTAYCDKASGWLRHTHLATVAEYPHPRDPFAVYAFVNMTEHRRNGNTCFKTIAYADIEQPQRSETYFYSSPNELVGVDQGAPDGTTRIVTCADGSTYSENQPPTAECEQWSQTYLNSAFCRASTSGSCAGY